MTALSEQPGFLFHGNIHESVPRALFLDTRLSPLEHSTWVIIRMLMVGRNITIFPSYETLRKYLKTTPCAEKASLETVSRALTILRLTGWISLVRQHRSRTGQVQNNLYIVHDEPLRPSEAIRIDPEYFALVSKALDHPNQSVQYVGLMMVTEITQDPAFSGQEFPTRIQLLLQQLETYSFATNDENANLSTAIFNRDSEVGPEDRLRFQKPRPSDSESGLEAALTGLLRKPKASCSSSKNKIHTTEDENPLLLQEQRAALSLPAAFETLPTKQQTAALKLMRALPGKLQQDILVEWAERCKNKQIRVPAAYLTAMVQRAYEGRFNELKSEPLQFALKEVPGNTAPAARTTPPPLPEPPRDYLSPEEARPYIDAIRDIVKRGTLRSPDNKT